MLCWQKRVSYAWPDFLQFDGVHVTNVTNNHPILTGKIVLAHLKETMDYYARLDIAELEGDLLKAIVSKDSSKIESKYKKLIQAQGLLSKTVSAQLK